MPPHTVKAQLFSSKGFLGPELNFTIPRLSKLSTVLTVEILNLPDKFEDVETADWTEIKLTVIRGEQ